MRLGDNPPTKYGNISPSVRNHLQEIGILDAAEWERRAEEQCDLCASNAGHWWSRCVKIWASTPKGFALLGQANAAKQLAQLHESSVAHLMNDFAPLLQRAMNVDRPPGDIVNRDMAQDAVFQLMDMCDIDDYYEFPKLFATVNVLYTDVHSHALMDNAAHSA